MKLHDNKLIEGVLIPSKKRVTACVSSQIGCSLSCTFCATGTLRLSRNLSLVKYLIRYYTQSRIKKIMETFDQYCIYGYGGSIAKL